MRSDLFFLFIFTLLLYSCQPDVVEVLDQNGKVKEQFQVNEEGLKHGEYKMFDPSGQLLELAQYKEGLLDGERRFFYEEGQVQYIEQHVKGQYHGPYRVLHKNGKTQFEGNYVNNAMQGEWRQYYKDGTLRQVMLFVDNQENGPFVEYWPSGKLKNQGNYLNGDNYHGELEVYDEQGELLRKMKCDRGVCHTYWKAGVGHVEQKSSFSLDSL